MVVALLEFLGIVVCIWLALGALAWLYMRTVDLFTREFWLGPRPIQTLPERYPDGALRNIWDDTQEVRRLRTRLPRGRR